MAILITIIGFGIMVFLHELGHFIAAKRFGVLVHEFAIGMGPKLVSFGKGETKYSLRLLPIGGYVRLEGEGELEENDNPRSFSNLAPIKRIIILFAGAFMNILLGFLLFTFINLNAGIVPPFKTDYGYKLGVVFETKKGNFFECAEFAVYDTIYITKAVIFALGDLISGRVGINSLSGPVEIVSVVGSVASTQSDYTFISVLMLFAMITVNLGVFNLLPFPALDGGSIIFALYELITKRKVKSEIVGYASMIGFALLMILAVIVTVGDITDLIK